MISGSVTVHREPRISLRLCGARGQQQDLDAIVDTGFNGFLTLPPALIAALGFPLRGRGTAILADGTRAWFNLYAATLLWDGQLRVVEAELAGATPLVGMGLLDGYKLTVEASIGGTVTIEPAP
jgi:clan AA aspartic protease